MPSKEDLEARATAIHRKALERSNDYKQLLALADTVAGTGALARTLIESAAALGGDHLAFARMASERDLDFPPPSR